MNGSARCARSDRASILSAPTYQSEIARAQGFGARSLNEFKQEHSWQRGGESPTPFMYSFDLATNEDLGGGHTLDKHVGKTDEQLLQRHRDQTKPSGKLELMSASSFADFESAQKYTQYNIRHNTAEIQKWLKNPPPAKPALSIVVSSIVGRPAHRRRSDRADLSGCAQRADAR
ncbi:RNase A-like domain-containing protein [Streptomyces sp. NPDC091204]|uniref:RNase A-like domain-containing protein n=1 Tax=Streptomyces sp. NPDC091204 TaxID=3155299 RepID=UPI003419EF67